MSGVDVADGSPTRHCECHGRGLIKLTHAKSQNQFQVHGVDAAG
jgi:hypothetical protein